MSDDEGAFTTGEVLTNNQSTENTTTLDVDKEIFDFGKDLDLPQIQPEENGLLFYYFVVSTPKFLTNYSIFFFNLKKVIYNI